MGDGVGWCDYGASGGLSGSRPEVIRKSSGGRGSWICGIGRRGAPPQPRPRRALTGGGRRAGRWPRPQPQRGQALEGVDNFPHLRVLWIAPKSLISFITYARLTENTSHDIHYVKS
jgi:hypothetical protein